MVNQSVLTDLDWFRTLQILSIVVLIQHILKQSSEIGPHFQTGVPQPLPALDKNHL